MKNQRKQLIITISFFLMNVSIASELMADTFKFLAPEYPPYQYKENKEVKGIFPDLVTEAFKRMGHNLTMEIFPWPRVLLYMEKGEGDVATAFKTPEREKFMDYSKEIFLPQTIALFVRKDSDIQFDGKLIQLQHEKFGIVSKISYGKIVDDALSQGVLKKIQKAVTGEQSVRQLLAQRYDIMISNTYGAYFIFNRMKVSEQVKELQPLVQRTPTYLAFSKVRKLTKLRDDFDKTLIEMKKDGSYDQILSRYNLGATSQ